MDRKFLQFLNLLSGQRMLSIKLISDRNSVVPTKKKKDKLFD